MACWSPSRRARWPRRSLVAELPGRAPADRRTVVALLGPRARHDRAPTCAGSKAHLLERRLRARRAAPVARRSGMPFESYLHDARVRATRMQSTTLDGSPACGVMSTIDDLAAVRRRLPDAAVRPRPSPWSTTPQLPRPRRHPPRFGRQDPNAWGLGPEIRGQSHRTGPAGNSPEPTGTSGAAGTFLWWDPAARVASSR